MKKITPGTKFGSVDEYISVFDEPTHSQLMEMRRIINAAAPMAVECISYNMPAIKVHGVVVYYAGYKNHIGLYPTGSGIAAFASELTVYKTSKGAVQFPVDKKLPKNLISKMVKFRLHEDAEKHVSKKK